MIISRIFCAVAAVLTVLAIFFGVYFRQSAQLARAEVKQVAGQLDSANAVIGNVQLAMKIFSVITAERVNEKERDRQKGELRRAALRAELQGDRCAFEPVPVAAERRLLDRAGGIRPRAVPAHSGGAASGNASALPAP
ncbi:hypothetical protein FVB43_22645 [Erwinia rhapontici]|uniref:hypothetical protein n=1 Tax=Erwinia rhapontici TaxID=55212 RepID=UPI0014382DE3|nr:hypothetical protein [Erwinia rhapontici]NKG32823.1 hypothetical protein [Erwinia rhapontici]